MRRTNWQSEMDTDRMLLLRILAMFFALAGLDSQRCELSRPLRLFLLRALRPAEAVALNHIVGLSHFPGTPALPPDPETLASQVFSYQHIEAMHPAVRLYALKLMLATLLKQVRAMACGFARRFGVIVHPPVEGTGRFDVPGWDGDPCLGLLLTARSPPVAA